MCWGKNALPLERSNRKRTVIISTEKPRLFPNWNRWNFLHTRLNWLNIYKIWSSWRDVDIRYHFKIFSWYITDLSKNGAEKTIFKRKFVRLDWDFFYFEQAIYPVYRYQRFQPYRLCSCKHLELRHENHLSARNLRRNNPKTLTFREKSRKSSCLYKPHRIDRIILIVDVDERVCQSIEMQLIQGNLPSNRKLIEKGNSNLEITYNICINIGNIGRTFFDFRTSGFWFSHS